MSEKYNKEAIITINGELITDAMSSTIRTAIESMAVSLVNEGLGNDEHGKEMTKLYLDRIAEIRKILYKKQD